MEDIVEDLQKIFLSAIDSYNSKIKQTVNEKYTMIDRAMLATYIYIKLIHDNDDELAKNVLRNYLLKQMIYGETGNLDLQIADKSKETLYKEIIDNLIIDQFEYKNRILKKLKYNYEITKYSKYDELIKFCERVAEYFCLRKLYLRGNCEVKITLDELEKTINKDKKIVNELFPNANYDEKEFINLMEVALNLREVYRYSTLTSIIPDNVLFHQYLIAVTSIIFSEYINSELNENIDIYKIICKAVLHDFSEYTGNEIVCQVKYYNEETQKMFSEMEEVDENILKQKIGRELYEIICNYKADKEGYIANLLDKIFGILKIIIEIKYMNNFTYIKALCSVYQDRFKVLKNVNSDIKNKQFMIDILREAYIWTKENIINSNKEIVLEYFTEQEYIGYLDEIKSLKENKQLFLK